MQLSKVAFIALARELLDKVSLSLALERSGNVSQGTSLTHIRSNPHTYVGWLNPGSTRIRQNRISADRVRTRSIRVQPGLNPGSRVSADRP